MAGAVSVTAGLVVLVYAIVKAQAWGWGSGRTLGLVAVALALLTAFVAHRAPQSQAPLMRLSIFKMRSLAAADLVLLLVAAGLFAMFFFASLLRAGVLGYSPLKAGLAFLPVTAGHRHRRRHRPAAHRRIGRTRGHAPRHDDGRDRHGSCSRSCPSTAPT